MAEGGGMMNFLMSTDPGIVPADILTGFVYLILRVLAFGALGVVLVGVVTTCWCCLFECRKWKRFRGHSEFWRISGS
jgi:hypothetical protein